jgi:hypothetical protein
MSYSFPISIFFSNIHSSARRWWPTSGMSPTVKSTDIAPRCCDTGLAMRRRIPTVTLWRRPLSARLRLVHRRLPRSRDQRPVAVPLPLSLPLLHHSRLLQRRSPHCRPPCNWDERRATCTISPVRPRMCFAIAHMNAGESFARKTDNIFTLLFDNSGAAPILYGLPENAFYRE